MARHAHVLPPLGGAGEIRGGRFVAGFSGEQYATPEAVGLLRDVRRKPHTQQYVSLSAADPLNLIGIITPGQGWPRLPAIGCCTATGCDRDVCRGRSSVPS